MSKLSWVDEVESSEQLQRAAVARWCRIVHSKLGSLDIGCPVKSSSFTAIERSSSAMADANSLSVLLRRRGDLGDSSISVGIATPLEDSGLVVDHIDIDVLANWHHSDRRIDGVLVLIDEDGVVQSVGTLLVATKVIGVQEVSLA